MTVMSATATQGPDTVDAAISEEVHLFGGGLVGTLSRPAGRAQEGVALVLLNAGLVHRVGPFRMYVDMARMLAGQGFVVFRFDQSGLGDSPVSQLAAGDRKRSEVVAAMDLVTRLTGIERFVVGGLCSGADDAFNIAPREERVHGLLLLDGVGYVTFQHRLRHVVPRLFNPGKVWRGIKRLLQRYRGGGGAASTIDPTSFRDFPERDEAVRRLQALDARGAQVLMLYTGGVERYYNHRRQAVECFGSVMRSPRMATKYWPECDHTFYARAHRQKLLGAVAGWMSSRFRTQAVQ